MVQYAFFFDKSQCTDCRACVLSCRNWNDLSPGAVKWCRVFQWEKGVYPNVRLHILFAPCYHCEDPICIRACKSNAIYKEEKYGAVLVNQEKCHGDRRCLRACPYGAPQFHNDAENAKMSKCNMCVERLEDGYGPICVESCPMRALDFGPLEDLINKYGNVRDIEDIPKSSITQPAIVFKPHENKEKLIPYDEDKALYLLARRDAIEQLPSLYSSKDEIVNAPIEIVGRNSLKMKHSSSEAAKHATQHDE